MTLTSSSFVSVCRGIVVLGLSCDSFQLEPFAWKAFAWVLALGIFRFGLSRGMFLFNAFEWKSSPGKLLLCVFRLGNVALMSFVCERSLRNFSFAALASPLSLSIFNSAAQTQQL